MRSNGSTLTSDRRHLLPERVGVRERRLVIGYKMGGTTHFYLLFSARKYVGAVRFPAPPSDLPLTPIAEQFSNGITILSIYLNPLPNSKAPSIENSIFHMKEVSLLYCLPDDWFFRLVNLNTLCRMRATHVCASFIFFYVLLLKETLDVGWVFAQHFCNCRGPSYLSLKNVLDEMNPTHAEVLNDIKRRFREETFTRENIAKVIEAYPELVGSFSTCVLYRPLISMCRSACFM